MKSSIQCTKQYNPLISINQQFITLEGKEAWALIDSKEMKAYVIIFQTLWTEGN